MSTIKKLKAILAKYSNQIQKGENVCKNAVKCHAVAEGLIALCQQGLLTPSGQEFATHYAELLVECLRKQDFTIMPKILLVLQLVLDVPFFKEFGEETHVFRADAVYTKDGKLRCELLYSLLHSPCGLSVDFLLKMETLGISPIIEISEDELDPTSDRPVAGADYEVSFDKMLEADGTVHISVRTPYILKRIGINN